MRSSRLRLTLHRNPIISLFLWRTFVGERIWFNSFFSFSPSWSNFPSPSITSLRKRERERHLRLSKSQERPQRIYDNGEADRGRPRAWRREATQTKGEKGNWSRDSRHSHSHIQYRTVKSRFNTANLNENAAFKLLKRVFWGKGFIELIYVEQDYSLNGDFAVFRLGCGRKKERNCSSKAEQNRPWPSSPWPSPSCVCGCVLEKAKPNLIASSGSRLYCCCSCTHCVIYTALCTVQCRAAGHSFVSLSSQWKLVMLDCAADVCGVWTWYTVSTVLGTHCTVYMYVCCPFPHLLTFRRECVCPAQQTRTRTTRNKKNKKATKRASKLLLSSAKSCNRKVTHNIFVVRK